MNKKFLPLRLQKKKKERKKKRDDDAQVSLI